MVYDGWSYRRPILITENSGSDLSDYAVKITLDSSNFDSWDKVNPDGSDIRFTDDQGNPLSYWIEKFDSVNQEAIIWVKIPILQANSQITIYMYYGNPNSVSESNGDDVFSFFDDFEDGVIDTNKWDTANAIGNWEESNGAINHIGSGKNGFDILGSVKSDITDNFVIESRIKEDNSEDIGFIINWNGNIVSGILGRGYYVGWGDFGTRLKITRYDDGAETILKSFDNNPPAEWTTVRIIRAGSLIRFYYDGVNYTEVNDASHHYGKIALAQWGTLSGAYWDWIRVRKYTDPEPSVTIMSEEYIGATISVYDSLLVQNAYISMQRVIETSILVSDYLLVKNAEISLIRALEPSILVSDLLAVKSADISISKLLEPTILVSDSLLVKNANIDLIRALEPSILVSDNLLVKNASISISRSLEPVISVSDSLLVQNAYLKLIREISPSISVSDSLLINNAYIQMLASEEPFITVRDSLLIQNADINLQRLLETIISISGLWAVRNATITLQRTKVTKPSVVSAENVILFASALGILYALAKKREEEKYGKVSYY